MKQWISLFLALTWTSVVWADLKYFDGKSYQTLQVREFQQLKLSVNCFKTETPQCEAWAAAQKKADRKKLPQALAGNPAARYCLDAGGENIIAKSEGSELDYCRFKDGSMIEAWGLYEKFNPISVKK